MDAPQITQQPVAQAPERLVSKLKLPGRTFQLPSRGALYKHGEVSNAEGEIHVHALSALAEINLKNPDLLFNGKAIEGVFAECIPEIKHATELYGRDIDAIMYFMRIVTYGPDFQLNVKHTCEGAKEHSYVVNLEQQLQKMKYLDPTTVEEKFSAKMPNGQVVRVHPIKFSHMIKLFQMNTGKTEFSVEDQQKNIVFNLTNVIESIDGVSDKGQIEEWVRASTTVYQNRITEAIERTNEWGPVNSTTIKCRDCGADIDLELPLNPISFFTE
jgi:hypothetical protein